jgi:excisionase family DNA binding protein
VGLVIDLSADERRSEYMSVAEVAMELGVSAPTVRRKVAEGELAAVQLGGPGSSIRIPRAALEAWLWAAPERSDDYAVRG